MFSQRLVAMRYSQVRSEDRSSNPGSDCQADSNVLLQGIVGVGHRPEDAVAVHMQLAAVRRNEVGKGLMLA
jgi:hypothetical protein